MIFLAGMQKMSGRVTSEVAVLATSAVLPLLQGAWLVIFLVNLHFMSLDLHWVLKKSCVNSDSHRIGWALLVVQL